MAKTRIMVRQTAERVVVEEWFVCYADPETGEIVEFDLFCPRGTFFTEFRRYMTATGLDSQDFDIESDTWARHLLREHR
jgi:hypothetical protein